MQSDSREMTRRLLAAVDLMEFGIGVMRQNIRRALPVASEGEIAAELARWLFEQPAVFRPGCAAPEVAGP